jgi:hypothetical protein
MRHALIASAALVAASLCFPASARSEGKLSAGVVLLRHDTELKVESATDFDGSDRTAEQSAREWDALGSAAGVRISYEISKMAALFGEGGITQATVRDKDVVDPDQNIDSRGLDEGAYFGAGARLGGDFSPKGNTFWQVSGSFSTVSTALDEDINTSWDYDETKIEAGARVGTWVQRVGVYGGLRFVSSNANLDETDRTNPVGQQTRTTELQRDGSVDVLLGAQTRRSDVSGFAEVGLVGTFSVNAGVTLGF